MTAPSSLQSPKPTALTKKDFESDQTVRWCPGCGDFAILAAVQKTLPTLGIPRENFAFISGIGCSSRFPYYVDTYGMHTIHGRAPAIASGLKISRPDLEVWVATGDGDGLSIGGNHLIHAIRRNVGLKIVLFNNRIYGLTKGQFSPTSVLGQKTKSTPYGNIDSPFNPLSVALGAEGTFVARAIDTDAKQLSEVLTRAATHKGTAFIEVLQNCVVFNDGAFDALKDKDTKADAQLPLEHGKPMLFGKEKNKGIRWNVKTFQPEVVQLGVDGVKIEDILVHDEHAESPALAFMLSRMGAPNFPTPIGVFRAVQTRPAYEESVVDMEKRTTEKLGEGSFDKLFSAGAETWQVR